MNVISTNLSDRSFTLKCILPDVTATRNKKYQM